MSLQLNALSRITPHLDFKQKKFLINSFFISQFNYCQLIWMCHNGTKNNKINRKCSFHDLLEKDGFVSIDYRNLRALATEMYRIYNGVATGIVTEISPLKPQGQYNLRRWSDFTLLIVRTVNYGIESIRYLGPIFWESIPANIKKVDTIERF